MRVVLTNQGKEVETIMSSNPSADVSRITTLTVTTCIYYPAQSALSICDYSRGDTKWPLIEHIVVNIWRIVDDKHCLDWSSWLRHILPDPWVVALFIAQEYNSDVAKLSRTTRDVIQPTTRNGDFWRNPAVQNQNDIARVCWDWLRSNSRSSEKSAQ